MTDPLLELAEWRKQGAPSSPEPDAMVIATATRDGAPSARVVLCRGLDARGAVFYTNYESRKGGELGTNPRAAAVFFWPALHRQARLEGRIERVSAEESDAYFHSRPRGHQLGAWASPQSRPIGSLGEVQAKHQALEAQYQGQEVPRPPHWGGYRLLADIVELWEAGENRLHSRRRFVRTDQRWNVTLLGP